MTEFRFPTKIKASVPKKGGAVRPIIDIDREAPPGRIRGKQVESKEEWRWALSAYKFGWQGKFEYQIPLGGGRQVRGGQILDFLFYTVILLTPIYIDGFYWHAKNTDDIFRRSQTVQLLRAYGPARTPESVLTYRLATQELSDEVFYKVIGPA